MNRIDACACGVAHYAESSTLEPIKCSNASAGFNTRQAGVELPASRQRRLKLIFLNKMDKRIVNEIQSFRQKILSANKELTKKELFKDLLNLLYAGNDEIERIIDSFSLGADKTVLNIPRRGRDYYGSADTL